MLRPPPRPTLFPYTTLFRSVRMRGEHHVGEFERELQRGWRSEEHTSELQSHLNLVCRLLLEKKNDGKAPVDALACDGRDAEQLSRRVRGVLRQVAGRYDRHA